MVGITVKPEKSPNRMNCLNDLIFPLLAAAEEVAKVAEVGEVGAVVDTVSPISTLFTIR
jgi:hypothetical protein